MAIDYGAKSIGVAISDELQLTVRPLTTIRRGRKNYGQAVDRIRALVAEYDVAAMAVGMPLNMDGTRGPAAARVKNFIEDLRRRLSIPIVEIDERLTSYEADQRLRELGFDQHERRARSDEYAATIILQDYLDGQRLSLPSDDSTPRSPR